MISVPASSLTPIQTVLQVSRMATVTSPGNQPFDGDPSDQGVLGR